MRFAARFAASIVGFGTIVVIAGGAAGAPALPPAPAPDSSPTADSIRTLVEQGQYPQALAQANRALAVKGAAARGYNRYDVLVLKGEALLRMKNQAAAASAFDDAAGFAAEEKAWALARSMAELVRRSKNLTYTPAPAPPPAPGAAAPKPFDVTDKSQRTPAFAAMFEESKPKVAAAVKAVATSSSLPDVLEVMRKLADLRTLELAATEDTAASTALAADITSRARSLMARGVADMAQTVQKIETAAATQYEDVQQAGASQYLAGAGQFGLTRDGVAELRRIAADCDRVARIASEVKAIFGGDEGDALRTLHDDAAAVATHARDVERNYRSGSPYLDPNAAASNSGGAGGLMDVPINIPQSTGPGTNRIQRPAPRGNPAAGPRGVGTGGVGTGTR